MNVSSKRGRRVHSFSLYSYTNVKIGNCYSTKDMATREPLYGSQKQFKATVTSTGANAVAVTMLVTDARTHVEIDFPGCNITNAVADTLNFDVPLPQGSAGLLTGGCIMSNVDTTVPAHFDGHVVSLASLIGVAFSIGEQMGNVSPSAVGTNYVATHNYVVGPFTLRLLK